MARRTEYKKELSCTAEQVYKALSSRQYWDDRIADIGGTNASVVSFNASDNGIEVELQQFIKREKLPSVAQAVIKNDMTIIRKDTWGPFNGSATGDFFGTMKGGPGDIKGPRTITASGDGCVISATVEARVSVPIVGGKLEKLLLQNVESLFSDEDDYTAKWVAKNLA
ncbi:DUF2505 domain-containing protein [Hoyosella rhizosphaerae]|nr:DUF2505 domain-containing protein [Hoyosella rhizosphaerae]MBN4928400.1 DUF2505 domain-containing protein [Hoyosella rhizosphaerae]